MKFWLLSMSALLVAPAAYAQGDPGPPSGFDPHAPTHYVFGDRTDLSLTGKYQYDIDRFSSDGGTLQNAQTNRRKELGVKLKKKGAYDAVVLYDFLAKDWLDVFLRVQSEALVGRDLGAFRIGYSKTLVGFEGNTGTGATTFLEAALPTQAVYAGRRVGVDWALERSHYVLNARYDWADDLRDGPHGHTVGARAAWVPRNQPGDVVHLGLSASRATPQGNTGAYGVYQPPMTRLRARPEAGLTDVRLVDTGLLREVDRLDRRGVEALWIAGPWSLQGEYLDEHVTLQNARPAFHGHGYYAFATWTLTGESRSYANGYASDVKPEGRYGAVELELRYSELDLNDRVLGGTEHDWTAGMNWYINTYLKLQANYVRAVSNRRDRRVSPNVIEARAQIAF